MTTFYAIRATSYQNPPMYMIGEGGFYKQLSDVPKLVRSKTEAKTIINDYKRVSRNSGKGFTPTEIVEVKVGE